MLKSISNFANDAIGVEKTLKLLQSTSQIAANIGYWSQNEAIQWTTAKNQFALARRFFRLFKWIDCWSNAYNQYEVYTTPLQAGADKKKSTITKTVPAQDGIHFLLLVSKWSLLGAYLFLEFFTTIDAILGTWRPWAVTLQIESLKFWFYALSVSVVLDLYELFFVYPSSAKATKASGGPVNNEKKKVSDSTGKKTAGDAKGDLHETSKPNPTFARDAKRRSLYRQLVIDSCDALIPGAAVGWLGLDAITVGVAGTISALVGGSDVWARVNT